MATGQEKGCGQILWCRLSSLHWIGWQARSACRRHAERACYCGRPVQAGKPAQGARGHRTWPHPIQPVADRPSAITSDAKAAINPNTKKPSASVKSVGLHTCVSLSIMARTTPPIQHKRDRIPSAVGLPGLGGPVRECIHACLLRCFTAANPQAAVPECSDSLSYYVSQA